MVDRLNGGFVGANCPCTLNIGSPSKGREGRFGIVEDNQGYHADFLI